MAASPRNKTKLKTHPMVGWFHPKLLIRLGWQVILSTLFGKYADHRIIQAALDDVSAETHIKRANLKDEEGVLNPDDDGAVWIDYVADLGEGFSSTYAVASLLALPELTVDGQTLPRGDVLILGGDEVYPTASRDEYIRKMREPYGLAFPDSEEKNAKHPRMYAIPGNHDWYDGLDAFSGTFCRFRDQQPLHPGLSIGSWRCKQSRSYFALQLTDDCWLWGLDIQLEGYVDQPQINYFKIIAEQLSDNARVIICTAQPSWLKAEKPGDKEYKSLNYIAWLVDGAKDKNQKAFLMIAGDIHHYSRYGESQSGMQFITAGGGGAFLHPTHQLKSSLKGDWLEQPITLTLANDEANRQRESCYPDKETSKKLLWGNWKFVFKNWVFCLALGGIFGVLANFLVFGEARKNEGKPPEATSSISEEFFQLLDRSFDATSSVLAMIIVAGLLLYYADTKNGLHRLLVSGLHSAAHLLILVGFTAFFHAVNTKWLGLSATGFASYLALFVEMALTCSVLSGLVWGGYLSLTCWRFGMHCNDGFSAMQIADYKNFLRIRIKDDEITIFPIGLNRVPKDEEWVENSQSSSDPTLPAYVSKSGLDVHLIEAPITINSQHVTRIERAPEEPKASTS